MTDKKLIVEVVTPEKVLFEETASYVTIPGVMGELGILPGHVPLLTEIKSGVLCIQSGVIKHNVAVHHGFAQVFGSKITVLGKVAELSEDIDYKRAQDAFKKAEEKLKKAEKDSDSEFLTLQAKMMRALTRQDAAKK